jgi:hypothetical protein
MKGWSMCEEDGEKGACVVILKRAALLNDYRLLTAGARYVHFIQNSGLGVGKLSSNPQE